MKVFAITIATTAHLRILTERRQATLLQIHQRLETALATNAHLTAWHTGNNIILVQGPNLKGGTIAPWFVTEIASHSIVLGHTFETDGVDVLLPVCSHAYRNGLLGTVTHR